MLFGVQREAKANIFSGLNNLLVLTVRNKVYAQYFGFSKNEVEDLLEYYGVAYSDEVRTMYGGYHIGDIEVYNPWLIMNYALNNELIFYCVNTSSSGMIKKVMRSIDQNFHRQFETLLKTKKLETIVDLQTSFSEYSRNSSLWGLLVNAGYLTITSQEDDLNTLSIPNDNVMNALKQLSLIL